MTAEEFGAMPDDGKRHDLVKGVVVEVSRPKPLHSVVQRRLGARIGDFVDDHDLGVVTTEGGYVLAHDPDTVRGPDVGFVSKTRLPDPDLREYIPMGPDLAVEIVSPNDTATEINDKIKEYFRAGSRLVWVVYPDVPEVYVYSSSITDIKVIGIDGTLDGADVLPGFTLPLREVFKGLGD